jgi:hypothetical protein
MWVNIYWPTLLEEDYHHIMERSFAHPNDLEGYAGGRGSGHPCQTGQRVGARRSIGSSGLVVECMANDTNSEKLLLQNLMEEARHAQGCSASKREEKINP